MAYGVLNAECQAFQGMKKISDALSLKDVSLSRNDKHTNDPHHLEQACRNCSCVSDHDKNPHAVASECGCLVGHDGMTLCFRHAFSQNRCRRCGCPLSAITPTAKKRPQSKAPNLDKNGIRQL